MFSSNVSRSVRILTAAGLLAAIVAGAGTHKAAAENGSGAVFTLTNEAAGNAVVALARSGDGTLSNVGMFSTGGLGTSDGLGSQGALALSPNGQWLFAVNAGSDEVSTFRVQGTELTLTDKVSSGGDRPISLTVDQDLLYVLNAGAPNNITGFRIDNGSLSQLAGSTRPLGAASVGPAQVQFSPDGGLLVVTEKMTNKIDTFVVGADGLASGPNVQTSAGTTPFGFAFDKRGTLVVSEAFGGAPDASAVSSYRSSDSGTLNVVSGSVHTTETAACWIAVTSNGKYAYTTNAGSGSVTGYSIGKDGSLSLLDADGRTGETGAGSGPADMAATNSGYLYALNSATDSIDAFEVGADGSLAWLSEVAGLSTNVVGLAAR